MPTGRHYEPVRGPVPERARTDHDPLHSEEYLLQARRRLSAPGEGGT